MADLDAGIKLFLCFEFCSSGTNDVETPGIPVQVEIFRSNFDLFLFEDPPGTAKKPNETGFRVSLFDSIKET